MLGEPKPFKMPAPLLRDIYSVLRNINDVSANPHKGSRKRKGGASLDHGSKARRRCDDFNGIQPKTTTENGAGLLSEADEDTSQPMLMSAKLRGLTELVQEWQEKAPDDKILSEFSRLKLHWSQRKMKKYVAWVGLTMERWHIKSKSSPSSFPWGESSAAGSRTR